MAFRCRRMRNEFSLQIFGIRRHHIAWRCPFFIPYKAHILHPSEIEHDDSHSKILWKCHPSIETRATDSLLFWWYPAIPPPFPLPPPHSIASSIYWVVKAPCSFCNRCTYCLETVFQADMYFSMHDEKQVCSPLEREDEGFGTQRSKQCSFTFYKLGKL